MLKDVSDLHLSMQKRNKGKRVTLCGKTNVLTYAFDLWERTFYEVAKEYPDIETDYSHLMLHVCGWLKIQSSLMLLLRTICLGTL